MSVRAYRWFGALCLLSWLGAFAVGCGGGGGVAIQSPTTMVAGRTVEQTEQAILEALPKRGWTAETVQPGRIVAFLSVRQHLLRAEIRYDPQQIGIYYVDSDNLAAHVEPDGRVYAHKKVNAWIQNLATDISASLAVAQPATSGGAAIAPPALPPDDPNAPPAPPPAPDAPPVN